MATVYVDADAYLDAVAYGAGDTITLRYGAGLTIRKSNTTYPFTINSALGTIKATTAQRELIFAAGGYVNCVAGDIGKTVVGAGTGDTGTLIDYNNATRTWHVQRTDPTDDQFDADLKKMCKAVEAGKKLAKFPGMANLLRMVLPEKPTAQRIE